MPVANFLDRSFRAASEVVKRLDRRTFVERLESSPIEIAYDQQPAERHEAMTAVELIANLAARLFPRIQLNPLRPGLEVVTKHLEDLCRTINPQVELTAPEKTAFTFVIGSTTIERSACVYVGSDNWSLKLSATCSVGSATSSNPFGSSAAACLAVGNCFRFIFRDLLPHPQLDAQVERSIPLLGPDLAQMEFAWSAAVDIGEAFLVGAGAIGNAFTWALARAPMLTGTLHIVDPEPVDLGNLQRYTLSTQRSIGKMKAVVAADAFAGTKISSHPHPVSWAKYLSQRGDFRLETAVSALDSAHARCEVQASLPARILNAWTQTGDLGISRHAFLGDRACLMCLYLPTAQAPNEDEIISQAIGLPTKVKEIRTLLANNTPMSPELLREIAEAKQVDLAELTSFAGKSLRTFFREAVCGNLIVETPAGFEHVPLAFQSAMAGILLAANLVLSRVDPHWNDFTTTRVDMLRPLGKELSQKDRKSSTGRCICQDKDYIGQYKVKYGQTSPEQLIVGTNPGI